MHAPSRRPDRLRAALRTCAAGRLRHPGGGGVRRVRRVARRWSGCSTSRWGCACATHEGFTDWQRRPLTASADRVRGRRRPPPAGGGGRAAAAAARAGPRALGGRGDGAAATGRAPRWCRIPTRPGGGSAAAASCEASSSALLVAVAAWREREARRRDIPAAWLVRDRDAGRAGPPAAGDGGRGRVGARPAAQARPSWTACWPCWPPPGGVPPERPTRAPSGDANRRCGWCCRWPAPCCRPAAPRPESPPSWWPPATTSSR